MRQPSLDRDHAHCRAGRVRGTDRFVALLRCDGRPLGGLLDPGQLALHGISAALKASHSAFGISSSGYSRLNFGVSFSPGPTHQTMPELDSPELGSLEPAFPPQPAAVNATAATAIQVRYFTMRSPSVMRPPPTARERTGEQSRSGGSGSGG